MPGLSMLMPLAILLGLAGLGAFIWSMKSGQFDDLDGASMRMLIDDEESDAIGNQQGEGQDKPE